MTGKCIPMLLSCYGTPDVVPYVQIFFFLLFLNSVLLLQFHLDGSRDQLLSYRNRSIPHSGEVTPETPNWGSVLDGGAYDDPRVIQAIRERFLGKPSSSGYDLMLDKQTGNRHGRASDYNRYRYGFESFLRSQEILQRVFNNSPPGFFLEAGAMDGEFLSNTLFLERSLGWNGLLVEPDALMFKHLRNKHRRSWTSRTCLSTGEKATKALFTAYKDANDSSLLRHLLIRSTSNLNHVESPAKGLMGKKEPSVEVQCFPLASFLLALNRTQVEYISLDVEGSEVDVLLHFPWNRVDVLMWSVEHRKMKAKGFRKENPPSSQSTKDLTSKKPGRYKVVYNYNHDPLHGKDEDFEQFMKRKGYELVDYWNGDYTFIKKDSNLKKLFHESNLK